MHLHLTLSPSQSLFTTKYVTFVLEEVLKDAEEEEEEQTFTPEEEEEVKNRLRVLGYLD